MATNAGDIIQLLQATFDAQNHRQAEAALREAEKNPGFSILLLQITASDSHPTTVRLASAICFKNLIRNNWTDEDGNHKLPPQEVAAIKKELVGLMISVPAAIQAQIGEAVSIIADSDFYERWDTLVDDLVSRLTPNDATVNNGVLQVAHSIFKRWRPLFRSDQLYSEINHVLSKFSTPFLTLLKNTDDLIEQNQNNREVLRQQFSVLHVSLELFYDLACQDLPPAFEDNLQGLTGLLEKYLKYQNPLLDTDSDSEVGLLENVKAEIFEILSLFVGKYEDEFGQYVAQFMLSSWNLLTTVGMETKNDILASRALNFLTLVCGLRNHAENFNNDETLSQVIEKVILPNVSLRESDIEMFEDEPIEFTRRELEGTDSETRRRAATDFLRKLMEQFQERVTRTVNLYIGHYLQEYSQDSDKWMSKDTAVYLFCSVAAIGNVTAAHGVKATNLHVDILQFFRDNVARDLVADASHIILQVDAIKFLYMFRSQMDPSMWQEAFPLLVQHLRSDNYVVHTYCAITIDRILYLTKDAPGAELVLDKGILLRSSKDILQRLFLLVEKNPAPEKVQENEFLMRCVMRVLITLREDLIPHVDFILTNLINITRVIRHNPSNPRFYYFLFEAIGALIRFGAPAQSDKLETTLYGPFSDILMADVQEFMPYVFQLFAALLESNPSAGLSEYYQSLIQPILMRSLWDSKGNTPALARLLCSLIARGATVITENKQLESILGIFQKLLASKSNDIYAFDILETIISSFPVAELQQYFPQIFSLLLTRLSSSRTENLALRFCHLYHFMSARTESGLGPDAVIALFDQVQSGVAAQIYSSVILSDTQKLSRPLDRKIAVISFTKTLADSNAFAEKYAKGWGRTCEALLKLMVDPPVPPAEDRIIPEQDVDDLAFGVGFTALTTTRRVPVDSFAQIGDLKTWIGQYLRDADAKYGGRIGRFVQERLSPELQQALVTYMQS